MQCCFKDKLTYTKRSCFISIQLQQTEFFLFYFRMLRYDEFYGSLKTDKHQSEVETNTENALDGPCSVLTIVCKKFSEDTEFPLCLVDWTDAWR